MAGRRTNLALLVAIAVALGSGALAFAVGDGFGRWIAAAHGVAGLAIIVLAPWKSIVVRRGLARRRSGTRTSMVFLVLTLLALAGGIAHATGAARSWGPITAMQLHVGAALLSIPFALWHIRLRRVRVHSTDASRRQLLRSAALVGASGLAYLAVEGFVRVTSLPGSKRRFTGSYETGSLRPERMPVTQWLNDQVPAIDTRSWRLRVSAPGKRRDMTYEDIAGFEERERAIIDCTGGWWAEQDWEGVRLSTLLGPLEGGSITVTSATGYARRFPVRDAHRLLVATRAGGRPLSPGHGAPARLVAPGRRGFWWVKWIDSIEVGDSPWWRQSPFPLT